MKHLCLFSIMILCATSLLAQDGFLDPDFINHGLVQTAGCSGDEVATAVQADGKIVIAGLNSSDERIVIRYDEDGTLDQSFGTGGTVTTAATYGYGQAQDILIQPDGKIVVTGSVKNYADRDRISVNRYNNDGTLDDTFNSSGTIMTHINNSANSWDQAFACTLTDNEKIVVGAYTEDAFNSTYSFAVIRYNSDGSLDNTFNSVGYVTTDLGYGATGLYNDFWAMPRCGVVVQPDNKIIYVGTMRNTTTADGIVIRFNNDGTLDSDFTNLLDFYGNQDNASSVALQGNDKIIVGGTTYTGEPNYYLKGTVVRLNNNGTLDDTFGTGGKVELDMGVPLSSGNDRREIYRVKIQNNGKILAGGRISTNGSDYDIGVSRFLYDGDIDDTFNITGSFSFVSYDKPKGFGMAIAPEGKIVISSGKENNNFFTARLAMEDPTGDGTSTNPYQISTMKDLYWLSVNKSEYSYFNNYFKQMNDIDASETTNWNLGQGWTPIGNFSTYFEASYDGNEFAISNLYINNDNTDDTYLGFFGYISDGSTVKNLKLINIDYTAHESAYIGGIAGSYYSENYMENCFATGSITGGYAVGGLTGVAVNIKNCFSSVIVNSDQTAGGLCGSIISPAGVITDSYSSGNVNGVQVGGLLGYNRGSVINCYSTGNVNGSYIVGGLIGADDGGSVSNSFWDIETSGTTIGYGNIDPDPAGMIGKTSAEMKMQSTYTDAGWDFAGESVNGTDDFWDIHPKYNEHYPYLFWQLFPEVVTFDVISVENYSAETKGEVLTEGNSSVNTRGMVWSENENPSLTSCLGFTEEGSGTGVFYSTLTNLSENTIYYFRAYATNEETTSYGELKSFTTENLLPQVETSDVATISTNSAVGGGTVINEGSSPVSARGIVWDTSSEPTLESCLNYSLEGSGLGSFTTTMDNLAEGTQYYVRAYATNSEYTTYGEEKMFITDMTIPGNALLFDGTDNYVEIPDAASLDFTQDLSAELWVSFSNLSYGGWGFGWQSLFVKNIFSSSAYGLMICTPETGSKYLRFYTGNTQTDYIWEDVQIDTWYHLAVVKDGSTAKIYINGEEKTVGSAGSIVNNEHSLLLGRNEGTMNYQLNGTLDEVRFWNYARSEAEITANMNDVLDGDEVGLTAYYRFDQLEGDLLIDRTTNNNDGALHNMDNSNWVSADWLATLEVPQNVQISITENSVTIT